MPVSANGLLYLMILHVFPLFTASAGGGRGHSGRTWPACAHGHALWRAGRSHLHQHGIVAHHLLWRLPGHSQGSCRLRKRRTGCPVRGEHLVLSVVSVVSVARWSCQLCQFCQLPGCPFSATWRGSIAYQWYTVTSEGAPTLFFKDSTVFYCHCGR